MKKITQAPLHWAYKFWSSVDVQGLDDCWEWRGAKNREGGYGRFPLYSGGQREGAHRIAYVLHYGNLGAKDHVLHSCDNPACCNPMHLRTGTHQDNMKDKASRGRAAKGSGDQLPQGEKHWNAKLNETQAGQIKKLIEEGWRNKDIAAAFGIAPNTVSQIRRGRLWKKSPHNRGHTRLETF